MKITKKTPIGISDFKEIINENCYFVDKSLLIKEVIKGSKIILYPRPRRFGKTMNLSMLRYFYDNSEDNAHLFENLAISQEQSIMQKQGKHPVIFITFKDVKSDNLAHCMESIYDLIAKVFDDLKYVLEDKKISDFHINFYNRIVTKTGSQLDFENSLKYMCEYLYHSHKMNPVILIDEYDMPIHSAYVYGYYDKLIIFIRNLLSACLKDNNYLEKAVMTGILRVAKESIFSGLNNLDVCSILQSYSSDKFGFTEKEVEKCLADYDLSDRLPEIKEWYDGYNFYGFEIYNPWSILNFLNRKTISPYWVNTSGNEMIKNLLQVAKSGVKKDLEILVENGSISRVIQDNIVYADVDQSDDALWNFLLMSGYLRYDNLQQEGLYWMAELSIPNKEVQYLFEYEVIKSWFNKTQNDVKLECILDYLTKGDLNLFKYNFIQFCQNSFSYFDVSGKESEKFYHAFVLGMIISLKNSYTIKSNRESGFGRYDIMMIPMDKSQRAIIFEFKKVNHFADEDFALALQDAKTQIIEKKYASELLALGISNIINVVAVFDKKEVKVEWFAALQDV
jgi:hypothetical protein